MGTQKRKQANDTSTEEKIKNAAKAVFHKKGFAATRTRDIAEEADINLALLNYYFRSKQKLFDIIMLETLQGFLHSMAIVFNDETTSFGAKIEAFADRYIDLLIREPEIPLFIMSELRTNPQGLFQKMNPKEMLFNSCFLRQYGERVKNKENLPQNVLQLLMNIIGLTVFPFVASPLLKHMGNLKDEDFQRLMLERKALIPKWIMTMLETE